MKVLSHIPAWLKNKYLIAIITFLVIILFFDENNLFLQFQRWQKQSELNANAAQLTKQVSETKEELNLLKTSTETVEKYAREKYFMKKDNEDLFIVEPPKK